MEDLFSAWPWLLLGSLFFLLLLLFRAATSSAARRPSLPGPPRAPFIGHLHHVGDLPHRSLRSHSDVHGAHMLFHLGTVRALVISSADAVKDVLKAHDIAFSGRPALYAARRLSYNLLDIAFAPYGEHWRAARRLCVSELLSAQSVGSFRAVREEEVAALVKGLAAAKGRYSVNLSEVFLATTNRLMRRAAFGHHDAVGIGDAQFVRMLEEAQHMLGGFWVADYVPWLGWLDAVRGMRSRLETNFRELDAFYDLVIEEHVSAPPASAGETEDLVDVLLRHHDQSRDQIKAVLTDMFIAGSNTSAAALTWAMTQLMHNPEILAKAQREIRGVVGEKPAVEEADLDRLQYLRQVMKECLRMHPPAPLLVPRETTAECTVAGCRVPAGTRVLVNASAIGRDPAVWDEPEEFRPERFEGLEVDFTAGGAEGGFVPFGFGRRSCPGILFATVMVELVLANVLHCFDWELPAGETLDMEEKVGLTVHKKRPLRLRPLPRRT